MIFDLNKDDFKLMENLKKQYDENLTQEQKNALIRYNSSLFVFFNKIASIDGYENMSVDELYTLMKPFIEQYSYIIKNLTLYISMDDSKDEPLNKIISSVIDEDVMEYDSIVERTRNPITLKLFDRIPEEYTVHETLKILVDDGVILPNSYDEDNIVSCRKVLYSVLADQYYEAEKKLNILTEARLEKIYKKLIANLLVDIKTIKSIPEDAIVLPKDIIVYRGVRTDTEINIENISESDFVSTSMSKSIAKLYITKREGNNNALISIKLFKGSSVFVFPQTVRNDGFFAHSLFLSNDNRIFEIMFDKSKVKNAVVLETETLETEKKL